MIERTLAQLTDEDRTLLAESSVQGQEFDTAIIAEALEMSVAHIEEQLAPLGKIGQIITSVGERDLADGTVSTAYAFTHVLYHNTLYDSLGATRKVTLSDHTARAVLAHNPVQERVAARVAILFEAARDATRAVQYYSIAAQHAASISAFPEAIKLARRGLTVLRSVRQVAGTEQQELPLLLTLGAALGARNGYGGLEVRRTYDRAYCLRGSSADRGSLVTTLVGLWSYYGLRGEFRRASHLSKQLLEMATEMGDSVLLARACATHGGILVHLGRLSDGRGLLERGLALECSEPTGARFVLDSRVHGLSHLAEALALLGYLDQAEGRAHEATELARTSGSPYGLTFALTFAALVHKSRRDVRRTRECADEGARIAAQYEMGDSLAWASSLQAWAWCQDGLIEAGINKMRALIETQSTTARNPQYFFGSFAEILATRGASDEAVVYVNRAIAAARKSGDSYCLPELFWVKGQLMASAGDSSGAKACFMTSIRHASRQHANTMRLKATTSLCRLLSAPVASDDGADSARQELWTRYSEFSEGRDTEFMKEVLQTLRSYGMHDQMYPSSG
jgi:hypothetical protein